jgi:hypothetical protein
MEGRPQIGALIARLDQAGAALRDVARMLGSYRDELIAAGFDRDEAIEFALDLQRDIMLADVDEGE